MWIPPVFSKEMHQHRSEHSHSHVYEQEVVDPEDVVYYHHHLHPSVEGTLFLSVVLTLFGLLGVTWCIARKLRKGWAHLKTAPLYHWLLLAVYIDSWAFIVSTATLQGAVGLSQDLKACDTAILLCLCFYFSSKLLYLFFVEKIFIARGARNRWRHKTWLKSLFAVLVPYSTIIVVSFLFRHAELRGPDKVCHIRINRGANIGLVFLDTILSVWLTWLFLKPLMSTWSYKHGIESTKRNLHHVTRRTSIGSTCALITTLSNLTALTVLDGREPGWVYFILCSIELACTVGALQWMTHKKEEPSFDTPHPCARCLEKRRRLARALTAAMEEGQGSGPQEPESEHTCNIARPEPCLAGPSRSRNSQYGESVDRNLTGPHRNGEATAFGMQSRDIPLGTVAGRTEFSTTNTSFPTSSFGSVTPSRKGKERAVPVERTRNARSNMSATSTYSARPGAPDEDDDSEVDIWEMLRSG